MFFCSMKNNKQIELMAPAGNFAAMQAAIDAGANSIYFGVEQLNMRARASINFTLDDLEEIANRCSAKDVRSYLTLNTIIYNHDLSIVKRIINQAKEKGITAVIAADQAVIGYAHSVGMEVHISTQLNVTNIETIRFYSHFADVMVLSRELSLRQMKEICEGVKTENITGPSGNLVEIEVFGHGALCMAVSGKCYLSLHSNNASANRGACVQNCRREYKVIDVEDGNELLIDNEYIMSPKDLCTLDFLDQLIETGISVLKIEGRGKGADYVHTTVATYRAAIDAYTEGTYTSEKVKVWMADLRSVFNRDFWSGYYLGQKMGEWTDSSGSKAPQKKLYLGKGVHYFPKVKCAEFKIEAHTLKVGDSILIIGPTTGLVKHIVSGIRVDDKDVQEAKKGDECTMILEDKIRPSDKLYKLIDS